MNISPIDNIHPRAYNFSVGPGMVGLSQSDVDFLCRTLSAVSEIETAIVFGSRAKGLASRGSDIDLAIKGKAVTEKTILQVINTLEELPLPYFYDVVSYRDIQNQDLINHIDRVGEILYQRTTGSAS